MSKSATFKALRDHVRGRAMMSDVLDEHIKELMGASDRATAVDAGELERDMRAFIARQYEGCHLEIEVARLGLGSAVHQLTVAHPRSVA
jgi:hypothetical protein